MPIDRRFVYAEQRSNGRQRLVLAELVAPPPFGRARQAFRVKTLAELPGEFPEDGSVPERWFALVPSRSNAHLAALSIQLGLDFIDCNVHVIDMASGTALPVVNEHRFSTTSKASCSSPLFAAFVASEAANGVPQSVIDGYDFAVVTEGTGIGGPELTWTTEETLLIRFGFDVIVQPGGFLLGQDWFEFEVSATDPSFAVLSCNAGRRPATPPPADYFGLSKGRGAGRITFHKALLPFVAAPRRWPWRWPTLGLFGKPYQSAMMVAGRAR